MDITTSSKTKRSTNRVEPTEMNNLAQGISKLTIKKVPEPQDSSFTREKLVQGLKDKTFKKIVFLTGAGISVSAGIPDFRSPKTGIYANLARYKLPKPEAVFDIAYFKKSPEPFYQLTKELLQDECNPTVAHYFIRMLQEEGLLHICFTQNIDGLEIKAGINSELLVEAHGNYRGAHCVKCWSSAPIDEMIDHIKRQEIYKCKCSGLIKPNIVFFGELLPQRFVVKMQDIDETDLVIIMGTSLSVTPFSELINEVSKGTPVVYINRENKSLKRKDVLFMKGDIDGQLSQLVKDLGWEEKLVDVQGKRLIK